MKTPLYYYYYMIPLLLGAIVSLKSFRLNWPPVFRNFSIYLWISLVVESFAILWKDFLNIHDTAFWHYSKSNGWIYNIYFIPLYSFYLYFFGSLLKIMRIKQSVLVLFATFVVFALINLFFIQGTHRLNTFTITGGCFLVIFLSCCYFVELVITKDLPFLPTQPGFWIVAGAFLSHLGIFTYYISNQTMSPEQLKPWLGLLELVVWSNTIMYTFYLTAFLCTRTFR